MFGSRFIVNRRLDTLRSKPQTDIYSDCPRHIHRNYRCFCRGSSAFLLEQL
jgi:hypothetical protein